MSLAGSNPAPVISATDEFAGKSNYFIGNDPKKWQIGVPTFAKVRYQNVYPGVDLIYYGNQGQLEHDFVVAPGGDPKSITMSFQGVVRLRIDTQGCLVLDLHDGQVRLLRPNIYQEADGVRKEIAGEYAIKGAHEAGFQLGPYDSRKPLVVDPVLSYSTYLGGSGSDTGIGLAVDSSGSAYVTGITSSANFPTTNGSVLVGTGNAFVAKLNTAGSSLVYSTYFGGTAPSTTGGSIAVDSTGFAYVAGATSAADFPVTPGAFQTTFPGFTSGFVTKLDPGGVPVYSTFLGQVNTNAAYPAIAVDSHGNAYITGSTDSASYPTTTGAFQPLFGGGHPSAFVTKLDPTGFSLLYSTYLGGTGGSLGFGIAVDSSNYAYVTGRGGANFPTTPGTFEITSGGAGFVTKLDPTGSSLVYSTYVGGDAAYAIAVDSLGSAYVTGYTTSASLPTTPGAFQPLIAGPQNGFVTKLNSAGTALDYSTYLGGSGGNDGGAAIAVDSSGSAYVTGNTNSTNFPTTAGAFQSTIGGPQNAFMAQLNAGGTALVYSTFLGGSGYDRGNAIAVDPAGSAYLTGYTSSPNFPTTSGAFQTAFQTALAGADNAFVTKIAGTPHFYLSPIAPVTIALGLADAPSVTINSFGGFNSAVTLSVSTPPAGVSASLSPASVIPPAGGSASSVLTLSVGPAAPLSTFTLTITGVSGSLVSTTNVNVTITASGVFTSANSTSFTVGSAGSFTVTTAGSSAPALSETGALPYGVSFLDNRNGTATLSGTPAAGTGGIYTLLITVSNGVDPPVTQTFTLTVNQAPAITSANSTSFTVGSAGSFTVTTTGFPAPALSETGPLPSGVSFLDNGNGTATLSGAPAASTAGIYTLTITASNAVGSPAMQTFVLTVNQAPVITSAAGTVFTTGTAGSFTVATTGFPAPNLSETGALPSGLTFTINGNGTATLSSTPTAGTGIYALTITASNGVGTPATQRFTLTVGQAPVITSASSASFTMSTAGAFTVTASGFPTPALSENGVPPAGLTFIDNSNGTATLSGTPSVGTAGTYIRTITATNGVGSNATQIFTLLVDQAPAITSTGSTAFTVGSVGVFSVTTTGFPTPNLSESGALPSGVTFTDNGNGTATLFGTPGVSGSFPITITANNGGGTTTQSFTLTVSGGTSGGTGSCACTKTGNYVDPSLAVDPDPSLLSPHGKYTVSAIIDNANQRTTLTVTRNSDGVVVLPTQTWPITANWGFSPDDDRLVINYLLSDLYGPRYDEVFVYDLASGGRQIVREYDAAAASRLQFSPSGRYFVSTEVFTYYWVYPPLVRVHIYKVQGVTTQDQVYQDQYYSTNTGWGFSPDNPETSFVYAAVAGQNTVQLNLVNLEADRAVLSPAAGGLSITATSAFWQFDPCGDVFAVVTQASAFGAQDEISLYSTATGQALVGSGATVPSLSPTLETTSSGQEVTYPGLTQPQLLSPSTCGQPNTPASSTSVTVTPIDTASSTSPVQVTFPSGVTQGGQTTLSITSTAPSPPAPTGFQLGNPPTYYNLSTTAVFAGNATVCINYGGVSFINQPAIRLYHYVNGSWVDITTSVDTTNHIVCGSTSSFSPFALFEPTSPLPQTVTASLGTPQQATINTTFGTPFQATVIGTDGKPMSGIVVTFAAPFVGATGAFANAGSQATATTDINGVAAAPAFSADGVAGNYVVSASVYGVAAPANFSLTNGRGTPVIAWPTPAAITYGTALSAAQLNATANVSGSFAYSPGIGTVLGAGSQTLSVAFTPSDPADYTSATASVTLLVTQASQTVSLAGVPTTAVFGQGPFTVSAAATSGLTVALRVSGNCLLSASSLSLIGVGTCTVTAAQAGNGNYNAAPTVTSSFTIAQDPTTTAVSVSPGTVKYSDYTSFSATVTPSLAGGQALTGNVQFYLNGNAVGSPVAINSSGVATLPQTQVNLSAGSYPVKAVFSSTNANFAGTTGTTTQTVAQENAFILYSGDTIAQVGTTLNLRATVWDSAAAGYPGVNPETGANATIGDITKMWIAFDIYPAGSCGSGAPSTLYAQVGLTSTAGVGIAASTLSSTSEVSYCVVSRLVAGSAGGTNQFYTAPDAETAGVDFYVNSGQFATGGGWVNDSSGSHGNFGFNARYNSTGSPKGQMVYIYRALYNGVPADFIIKSNALSALQFSGTTYPISSTLQGKANVQVNRASDGYTLFSAGNYTFSSTVTDSGQNGTTGKQFSLIVYDSSGAPYHSVPAATALQGGNVVVHSK